MIKEGVKGHRQVQYQSSVTSDPCNMEQLHAHMLLYTQAYDGKYILYTLHTLANILTSNPSAFLCAASSTALVSR